VTAKALLPDDSWLRLLSLQRPQGRKEVQPLARSSSRSVVKSSMALPLTAISRARGVHAVAPGGCQLLCCGLEKSAEARPDQKKKRAGRALVEEAIRACLAAFRWGANNRRCKGSTLRATEAKRAKILQLRQNSRRLRPRLLRLQFPQDLIRHQKRQGHARIARDIQSVAGLKLTAFFFSQQPQFLNPTYLHLNQLKISSNQSR
jgi:hypothetical protein